MCSSSESAPRFPEVKKLKVWYHFPFAISKRLDLLADGWEADGTQATNEQREYFHPFITDALWGKEDIKPLFDGYVKKCTPHGEGLKFKALKKEEIRTVTFSGTLQQVGLKVTKSTDTTANDEHVPRLGILSVEISLERVCIKSVGDTETVNHERPLNLGDAQDALDWLRRVYPRWLNENDPKDPFPGDTISAIHLITEDGPEPWMSDVKKFEFAPWVAKLLEPFVLSTSGTGNAESFGDERAFMTSAILLDSDEHGDFDTLANVSRADLFRLAEADPANHKGGPGSYSYQSPYVERELDAYLYDRHAPDRDSRTGNTTISLIAHHHLCFLGTGQFFENMTMNHVDTLYRHMQFLAIYEHFRLIQFSQRLSKLVRARRAAEDDQDQTFNQDLRKLHEDFLEFTHLHHFSNVSHQLQPREMYAQLYKALSIGEMHAEVAEEIRSASDFRAMREAQEAAERRERAEARRDEAAEADAQAARRAELLNRAVFIGVPISLVIGVTGSGLLVGPAANELVAGQGMMRGARQFAQIGLIVGITYGVWALICIQGMGTTSKNDVGKGTGELNRLSRSALGIALVGLIVFFLGISVPEKAEPKVGKSIMPSNSNSSYNFDVKNTLALVEREQVEHSSLESIDESYMKSVAFGGRALQR